MPTDLALVFDSLSPRLLGCYGGPYRTPAFDRLAAAGTVFDNCFVDGELGKPLPIDDDAQVVRLPGIADRFDPDTIDEDELFERIDPEVWNTLRQAVASNLDDDGDNGDPLSALAAMMAEGGDWSRGLDDTDAWLELELTLASLQVDAVDRQLALLWDDVPPESYAITLVATAGWALADERDALLDVVRHVPAIRTQPGRAAARTAALCTPQAILDGEESPQPQLLFCATDGVAVRDAVGLMSRRIDVATGERTERLFRKPDDRFNDLDIWREQPGLAEDYSAMLQALMATR